MKIFLLTASSLLLSLGPVYGANIEAPPTYIGPPAPLVADISPRLLGRAEITVNASTDGLSSGAANFDSKLEPRVPIMDFPEPTASIDDVEWAFRVSEFIGICEYRGYEKQQQTSYDNPPTANFRLVKRLKGPPGNSDMKVRYLFDNQPSSVATDAWKFGDDKMPTVGSRWIIFIPNYVQSEKAYETYKGARGRKEATDENLGRIYATIEAHHGQTEGPGWHPNNSGGPREQTTRWAAQAVP
jgi:hypothetical protein